MADENFRAAANLDVSAVNPAVSLAGAFRDYTDETVELDEEDFTRLEKVMQELNRCCEVLASPISVDITYLRAREKESLLEAINLFKERVEKEVYENYEDLFGSQ